MNRVVIAGGTGMIGRALAVSLVQDGRDVSVLSRGSERTRRPVADGVRLVTWDPDDARSAVEGLRGADVVVNVCGVPVGPLPWTAGRRRAIVSSRVGSTRTLVEAIGLLPPADRPRVLVNASGTDAYTGIDAEPATETAPSGHGFLADLGTEWEAAARAAVGLGRPSFVPVPGWAVRLVMREQATLILGSRRVLPARLLDAGMPFGFADLDNALADALGTGSTR